jgi:pyruvate kinase
MPPAHPRLVDQVHLLGGHEHAVCEAAVTLAERGNAKAIVAITRGGTTARVLSALRPPVPVFAATDRPEVLRRLALFWGVVPVLTDMRGELPDAASRIGAELVSQRALEPGSVIVLVSVTADLAAGESNFLKLQRV